jgi:hypothetical protein
MKKIILVLSLILFHSCFSQEKKSLKQMNEYLLNNNLVPFGISYLDSKEINGMKNALTAYRLLGTKACNINPNKKYSHIYIEDGFNNEQAYYDGIIVIDNKNICEITTNPYKLRTDSLSYTKIMEKKDLFAKKVSMEDFKKNYVNEYYRYELAIQNKVNDLKKCLAIDKYTPKPLIDTKSYYFTDKKIVNFGSIKIDYNYIRNGLDGLPYFKEDKKKEFTECINNLNIQIE